MTKLAQRTVQLLVPAIASCMLTACLMVIPIIGQAGGPVNYRTFSSNDYQSFIKNWDTEREPVKCAVLRSPEDWQALFGAAPIMGQQRPFAPPASLFEKEQILVAARVLPAPPAGARPFAVQSVDQDASGRLTLRYTSSVPASAAGYTIKDYVAAVVPRSNGGAVFVENGRTVCTVR